MSAAREIANLRSIPTNGNILLDYTAGDALDGTGTCNIAAGLNALGAITSGDDNIALGQLALGAGVTTGGSNIAIEKCVKMAKLGNCNIALGENALGSSTGTKTLQSVSLHLGCGTTDGDNIGIGVGALQTSDITSGTCNVAIGYTALGSADVSGDNNVAIGTPRNNFWCL